MNLDAYKDTSMLELFRQEAQAQTQVLNAGLLVLEREPTAPAQLEACMRAAHSLKGAARIVGLDAAVAVAHVMEDLLVAAQQGQLRLNATRIDALLQGSDALLHLSEGKPLDGLDTLQARLIAVVQDSDEPADTTQAPPPVVIDPEAPLDPAEPLIPVGPHDRILRVSADRLDLLLDLAGRSLVAAQRTKPLTKGLEQLKRLQDQIARSLSTVHDAMPGKQLPAQLNALLGDVGNLVQEAQTQLQTHKEAFDLAPELSSS